jgi:hypothetical protein
MKYCKTNSKSKIKSLFCCGMLTNSNSFNNLRPVAKKQKNATIVKKIAKIAIL